MAASMIVEIESGTCAGIRNRHNGYYAGDFSDVPRRTQSQLAAMVTLCRVPEQPNHPADRRLTAAG